MRSAITIAMVVLLLCSGRLSHAAEDQRNAMEHFVLGCTAYEQADYEEATRLFAEAAKLSAEYSDRDISIRTMLARSSFHEGSTTQALAALQTLETKYSGCDEVDSQSGGSFRNKALIGVATTRAWIFSRTKQYESAIENLRMEAKRYSMLTDEMRMLNEAEKAYQKLGGQNGTDLKIAEFYLQGGNRPAALKTYESVLERYRQHGTLALLGRNQKDHEKVVDRYLTTVYLKKKMADCTNDEMRYREALDAHRAVSEQATEELKRWIGKEWEECERLKDRFNEQE